MTEFGVRTPNTLIEAVRANENEVEESWREEFLAKNLFHAKHLDHTLASGNYNTHSLPLLEHDFLTEKQGKNMGERFELALSDKYLGKIHVVELGKTKDPGLDGAIDGLKGEYNDLLSWMKSVGIVEKELERSESGRDISERNPVTDYARGKLVIAVRNRPLIDTEHVHNGRTISIRIAKRMVFSMPIQTRVAVLARCGSNELKGDRVVEFVENMFLSNGAGGIQPIRTAYYLATEVL